MRDIMVFIKSKMNFCKAKWEELKVKLSINTFKNELPMSNLLIPN